MSPLFLKYKYLKNFVQAHQDTGNSNEQLHDQECFNMYFDSPIYHYHRFALKNNEIIKARREETKKLKFMLTKSFFIGTAAVYLFSFVFIRIPLPAKIFFIPAATLAIWTRYGYQDLEEYMADEMARTIVDCEIKLKDLSEL